MPLTPPSPLPKNLKIDDPVKYMKSLYRKKGKMYTTFLRGLVRRKVRGIDRIAPILNRQAFERIDCLQCANCCKKMSPTYKKSDVKRIAKHLGMTFKQYFDKWLYLDDSGDYMNKLTPCQFLQPNNMCAIYSVRPRDCSGFPHTQNRDFKLYIPQTHIQNIEYCPITMNVVERMHDLVINQGLKNISEKHTLEPESVPVL